MKILIAEDDPVTRAILEEVLAQAGYDVVCAVDGEEAYEVLRAPEAPPIAILDWMLPKRNGVEVCRLVREIPRSELTYILVLTARDRGEDIVYALDSGADDYLIKPFRADELLARIRVGERMVRLFTVLADQIRASGGERPTRIGEEISDAMPLKPRILIAEDDPTFLFLLQEALQDEYEIIAKTNGQDAWMVLQAPDAPQIAILDWMMPRMDGLTVCRRLRTLPANTPVYVLMLTARGETEDIVAALTAGADDYLVKPFSIAELQARIRVGARIVAMQRQSWGRARLAEQRYQSLFDNAVEGIYQISPEGRLLVANPALAHLLGYPSPQTLIADVKNAGEQFLADPTQVKTLTRRLMEEGKVAEFETQLRRRNGEHVWVSLSMHLIRDEEGRVTRYEGFAKDITDRKRAEEALRRELARSRLLNQIIRSIIEQQDLESIFEVALSYLEDHLEIDYSGILDYNETTDTLKLAAIGPKTAAIVEEAGWADGVLRTVDEVQLRPCVEGQELYYPDLSQLDLPPSAPHLRRFRSVTVIPLMTGDQVTALLVAACQRADALDEDTRTFLRQVAELMALATRQVGLYTDLQRAYDELRRTQQVIVEQERLRALGQMASGIAHDLNNALSPIVGYAQLLQRESLSDRGRRYLEHILTAGEDVSHIVARLRDFYRQREAQDRFTDVDFTALVLEIIELTRPRWRDMTHGRDAPITIRTELDENLPKCTASASEVREALTNLIFNAVDAMPQGGEITIRTRITTEQEMKKTQKERMTPPLLTSDIPAYVIVEVSDTGVGMDEETRLRCLEPFYSTKGEGGTGLGLPMVYGVMQRHEGHIEIISEVGQGTTIRLYFPLSEGTMRASATVSEAEAPPPFALRVLCVDDEPALRELLWDMLDGEGYEVELAEDGKAAIALIQEQETPFDVVITDLGMPGVNGRQLAEFVKRQSPGTAVILLTGWETSMPAEGDASANVDVVLGKPPQLEELKEVLAQLGGTEKDGVGEKAHQGMESV